MTYFNDKITFEKFKKHIGHHIECVAYGSDKTGIINVSLECETCNEVICDCDKPDDMGRVNFPKEYPEEIAVRWNIDDVDFALEDKELDIDPPFTNQEKAKILDYVLRHHNADEGVTWGTLARAAEFLYRDRLHLTYQD